MLLFRDTTPVAAVCRSAFCGNNIKRRTQRLANFTLHQGDSLMKKILIASCCALLLFSGLFEIKFVITVPPIPDKQSNAPFDAKTIWIEL